MITDSHLLHALVLAVIEADNGFVLNPPGSKSTKSYVLEYLIPALEEHKLKVIRQ